MIRTDVTRDVVNLLGSGAVNFVVRYIENVDDVQLYKSIKYFKKVGVERGDCDPKLVIKFTRLKDADNIWLFYNVNVVAAAMVQADRIKNCATQQ